MVTLLIYFGLFAYTFTWLAVDPVVNILVRVYNLYFFDWSTSRGIFFSVLARDWNSSRILVQGALHTLHKRVAVLLLDLTALVPVSGAGPKEPTKDFEINPEPSAKRFRV